MEIQYKLKSDAPYLFIFVHCPDGDINLTEFFDPRSEEQRKLVESGYLETYTRERAQKLCDNEEGWFTCLEEYVDEVIITSE